MTATDFQDVQEFLLWVFRGLIVWWAIITVVGAVLTGIIVSFVTMLRKTTE